MQVKKSQKFYSKQSDRVIRVLKIVEKAKHSRFNLVRVVDVDQKNKQISGTVRVIYADSIRRRYFK